MVKVIVVNGVNPLKLMDELTAAKIIAGITFPDKKEDSNQYHDVKISIEDGEGIDVEGIISQINQIVALHDPSIPQEIPLDEQTMTTQRIADLELMIIEIMNQGGGL